MRQFLPFQLVITTKKQRNIKLMKPKLFSTDLYVYCPGYQQRNELLLLLRFALHVINNLALSLIEVLLQVVNPPRAVDANANVGEVILATSSSSSNNFVVKSRFSRIVRNSREFSLLDLGLEAF